MTCIIKEGDSHKPNHFQVGNMKQIEACAVRDFTPVHPLMENLP